jgi:hypothetical protein
MPPTEAELAYRAALRALPDFRFGRDQLERLLRSLAPPPPGAPVAWRQAHLRGIIEEVRALDPRDPAEAMSVSLIIAARHAAADSARRSLDPTLTARQTAQLHRCAEGLLRAARQTERSLKKRQAGRVAPGQASAEVAFDLAALDAAWCGMAGQTPVPGGDPVGPRSGGHAGAGGPSPAAPREVRQQAAAPAPAERVKYTMCGQRVDLVRLATMPAAGTA